MQKSSVIYEDEFRNSLHTKKVSVGKPASKIYYNLKKIKNGISSIVKSWFAL